MTVTHPGLYRMTAEAYHADPTPEPSLSSTGARTLARGTPATFWHERQHPQPKLVFEIGTAAHLMVLEPDQFDGCVSVIEADDYRTKAAKEARDEARAAGLTPLLAHEAAMVRDMRAALWADPVARHAFVGGAAEMALFWRDAEFGVWCRTRPDYLPPHRRYLVDYKTSASADPRQFGKRLLYYGYHQQAAWYLDGVHAVTGERPERFAFVVQEKTPPYLVSVCYVDPEAIEIGRELNRYAIGLFAWCLRRGEWPGYRDVPEAPPRAFNVTLPEWAVREHRARSEAGAFLPPRMENVAA